MRCLLAKNIKLSLEDLQVEGRVLTDVAIAVVRTKNHKRLEDEWFLAAGSGAKNGPVGGNLTPSKYTQAQVRRNL